NLFIINDLLWLDYSTLDVPRLLATEWPALLSKFHYYLAEQGLWLGNPMHAWFLPPLALAGLVDLRARVGRLPDAVWLYLGSLAVHLAFFSFLRIEAEGRYLFWFYPFLALVGALGWRRLTRTWPRLWGAGAVFMVIWLSAELRFYTLPPL